MYNICKRGRVVAIYKSTLNTSKPKKQKKEKVNKIKVKQPPIIKPAKFALIIAGLLSAVFFVALCAPSNFVKNFLLGVVGISAYPICLLTMFLGIMGLGKTQYEVNKRYIVYLSCALFFVLMVVHLILTTKIDTNTYSQYLVDTYKLKTSGAGLIMSLFSYWMKKYLTAVGAYIFAIILLTVFVGLILDNKNVDKSPKEEQPKKSAFDFGGLISENKKEEDVPITIEHKQQDIKKRIAKQKLGLESGSSTIISSSMHIEDVPDTPKKYKSKREYILTPPEIVMPEYQKSIQHIPERPRFENNIKPNLESKVELNSDIFVTDTDEFYKDAKVIEGRDINKEDKIQEVKPSNNWTTNLVSAQQSSLNNYASNQIKQNNFQAESKSQNIWDMLGNEEQEESQPIQPESKSTSIFDALDSNTEIKPIDISLKQDKSNWSNLGTSEWNNSINQVFNGNSEDEDLQEAEYEEDFEEDIEEVQVEEAETEDVVEEKPQFEEINLASPNTSEVVHTNTFTTQPNVFKREVVEEKKEENLLGRPKKIRPAYVCPPTDLLEYIENTDVVTEEECNENIEKLERVLQDFKINAKVKAVQVGPAVTRYEIGMPQGVSVKKVQFHVDDIAMALASNGSIRIEAPIPGKNAVGIEVPNRTIMGVSLREMVESLDFQKRVNPMSFVLGKDINGSIQFCNLDKMPHLLVAGSTGSGKSVCLNTMLISMLYKSSPEDVKLILIDPKTVEFSTYANLPHLLTPNIITTKEQTINALNWAIKEMEYRYGLLQRNQVVNIKEYNSLDIVKNNEVEKLPYIVIVIDELGDLMIEAKREMEERIMKLAQKSRAAGIHLVIATQRPSVDVITGTIKANLPSRIAFALTNFADSKTVLDMGGAEKLLGKGDMLFKPNDLPEPRRVQGAFISSREVASVVKFIKENNRADFDEDAQKDINQTAETASANMDGGDAVSFDPVLKDALRFFIQANQASITMIQRRFGVGYARAARIIDQMEQNGFISPADGSKPRQVLISLEEYNLIFNS